MTWAGDSNCVQLSTERCTLCWIIGWVCTPLWHLVTERLWRAIMLKCWASSNLGYGHWFCFLYWLKMSVILCICCCRLYWMQRGTAVTKDGTHSVSFLKSYSKSINFIYAGRIFTLTKTKFEIVFFRPLNPPLYSLSLSLSLFRTIIYM